MKTKKYKIQPNYTKNEKVARDTRAGIETGSVRKHGRKRIRHFVSQTHGSSYQSISVSKQIGIYLTTKSVQNKKRSLCISLQQKQPRRKKKFEFISTFILARSATVIVILSQYRPLQTFVHSEDIPFKFLVLVPCFVL